ncbi:transcriptional regulator, TrmB [Ruminiclostridium cellulolyticum H10]|uniref:Transcriptional regulator, TrmB n=1 Tax=Ruminiclostridium cellulolyticum (strain ATCC 35319 / DSM 5812 / JCM 6584 / H10) TaxID=394503 RepID=B8I698_RUMCH|nr:transcriptional regulator, TrmB [Ruminiclostridium cellulolyticum H10]
MDVIDALMQAGFTRHESVLYVTLCREGELTGYEASKLTGIPRSNAYLGLAGLCDKGGAYKISGETAQYGPVPVNELVDNLKRKFSQIIKVIDEIPKVNIPKDTFVTINGNEHILNKMKNLINEAQYRIYISMARNQLELVLKELIRAKERGLKVVMITSDCTDMEGFICYMSPKKPGSFRLITDSSNVLTGHLSEINATGLFSMNKNMVDVIKDSLTNEIKLISIENNQD